LIVPCVSNDLKHAVCYLQQHNIIVSTTRNIANQDVQTLAHTKIPILPITFLKLELETSALQFENVYV